MPDLLLPALFVVLGPLLLGVYGWRRYRKTQADASPQLPAGTIPLALESDSLPLREELVGSLSLIGIGRFGGNTLLRTLILLQRSGLERLLGSCLYVENDSLDRQRFAAAAPACFRNRIIYGFTEEWGGGFGNKPIAWVQARIAEWGLPIYQAARDLLDTHLRLNHAKTPQLVLLFPSLGGQAPLALPVLEELEARLQGTSLIVAASALPRHERLRSRWRELKPLVDALGCTGWVLVDNLNADPTTTDYGLSTLPVAIAQAALYADQPTALNNTFALALTEAKGGVLVFQVVSAQVVAYPLDPRPTIPPYHYVYTQPLVVQLHRSLQRLVEGSGLWSADLAAYEPATSTFDICMVNVRAQDLRAIQDQVLAGLQLALRSHAGTDGAAQTEVPRYGQPNYELSFASIPAPIDPARPVCHILATRLTCVRDGAGFVDEIIKIPAARTIPQTLPAALNAGTDAGTRSSDAAATATS